MADRAQLFDPRLRPFLDGARIDCDRLFEFQCPQSWGNLQQTGDPLRRYCSECKKHVHLAVDEEQLRDFARRRLCVAVIRAEELPDPNQIAERAPVMMLGVVASDY